MWTLSLTNHSLIGFPILMELCRGLQNRDSARLHLATFLRVSSKWFLQFSMWLPRMPPKENEAHILVNALHAKGSGTWQGRETDWRIWDCRRNNWTKYFYMERTIDNYNVEICPLWKNTSVNTLVIKDIKGSLSCLFTYMCFHSRPIRGVLWSLHRVFCHCQCLLYRRCHFFLVILWNTLPFKPHFKYTIGNRCIWEFSC